MQYCHGHKELPTLIALLVLPQVLPRENNPHAQIYSRFHNGIWAPAREFDGCGTREVPWPRLIALCHWFIALSSRAPAKLTRPTDPPSAFTRPPMVIAGSWQTCSPPMITMGRCEVQREGHMGGIEREVKPLCDSVYRVSQGDVRIAHQGVATHCATHCVTWPLGAEEAWAG